MSFKAVVRKYLFWRDDGTCVGCGRRWNDGWYLECHHIVPVSEGGEDNAENGELRCIDCHASAHIELSKKHQRNGDTRLANANAYSARVIKTRNRKRMGWKG